MKKAIGFDLPENFILIFFVMRKTLFPLLLVAVVGLLSYSNSFHVPFQFDDFANISENPVLQRLGNFLLSLKGYSYNPRRFIGYLTLALNYHFGGLDVTGYHIVNLSVHIITAVLVYFFVVLTFRTPYFRNGQWAIDSRQEAIGYRQEEKKEHDKKTLATENTEDTEKTGQEAIGTRQGASTLSPIAHRPSPVADYSPFTIHHSRPSELIALFSALLFVSHPLQTEAVTYIVQRFASLTAMFYLLSVVMYVKGRLASRQAGKLAGYLLSFLSAVCAMKTKENSFTLPIALLLYEFMFFKTSFRKKLAFLVPLLLTIIIIPVSIIGVHKPIGDIISDLSEKTRLQTNIPRWDYLMTQMRVITTYIRLLFFPVNQDLDYTYPIHHSLFEPPVLLSFLFLATIFGTAVYLLYKARRGAIGEGQGAEKGLGAKGNGQREEIEPLSPIAYRLSPNAPYYRLAAFGILWFFITLSVESSFIPIVDVIFEHRVYLPSIGAFIAITTAVFVTLQRALNPPLHPSKEGNCNNEVPSREGIKGWVPRRWRERGDLHVKVEALRIFIVFFSLVVAALSALTLARNAVWQDGISLWKDVQAKSPGNARAYNNLGYIYLERGQTDRALEYFRAAVSFRPDYADARDNVGVAYYEKGMFDAAIEQFRAALVLQPGSADMHHNLGLAYVQKGLKDEALAEFETAMKIAPDNYELYNDMGVVYREKGLLYKAIESFRRAVALKPDYAGAHYNLGLTYQAMGVSDKAMEHLNKAHTLDTQKF